MYIQILLERRHFSITCVEGAITDMMLGFALFSGSFVIFEGPNAVVEWKNVCLLPLHTLPSFLFHPEWDPIQTSEGREGGRGGEGDSWPPNANVG